MFSSSHCFPSTRLCIISRVLSRIFSLLFAGPLKPWQYEVYKKLRLITSPHNGQHRRQLPPCSKLRESSLLPALFVHGNESPNGRKQHRELRTEAWQAALAPRQQCACVLLQPPWPGSPDPDTGRDKGHSRSQYGGGCPSWGRARAFTSCSPSSIGAALTFGKADWNNPWPVGLHFLVVVSVDLF